MPTSPFAPQKHRNRLQAGFSMVELVVVMVIVGIMMGLSVPVMSNVMAESAVYASASEIAKTMHLAQELAVVYRRPHAILFNNREAADGDWDPTGAHHWYSLLGPQEVGNNPSSWDYYRGDIIDPDAIQIGAHHYLRPNVRFWSAGVSGDASVPNDFDESNPSHIPGFASSKVPAGHFHQYESRLASKPTWAYQDFAVEMESADVGGKMNKVSSTMTAVFALPNQQFSRIDGLDYMMEGAVDVKSYEYPLFIGVVNAEDTSIRQIISIEQSSGQMRMGRDIHVAW